MPSNSHGQVFPTIASLLLPEHGIDQSRTTESMGDAVRGDALISILQILLESWIGFAEIMPQADPEGWRFHSKICGVFTRLLRNLLQMLFE